MYCHKCGKQLSESTKFCPYCGEPVKQRNFTYEQNEPSETTESSTTENMRHPRSMTGSPGNQRRNLLILLTLLIVTIIIAIFAAIGYRVSNRDPVLGCSCCCCGCECGCESEYYMDWDDPDWDDPDWHDSESIDEEALFEYFEEWLYEMEAAGEI